MISQGNLDQLRPSLFAYLADSPSLRFLLKRLEPAQFQIGSLKFNFFPATTIPSRGFKVREKGAGFRPPQTFSSSALAGFALDKECPTFPAGQGQNCFQDSACPSNGNSDKDFHFLTPFPLEFENPRSIPLARFILVS